jgi:hypothetical protein
MFVPFLVLAFHDFSSLRSHFWPFTDVLRKIFESLTGKVWGFSNATDCADATDKPRVENEEKRRERTNLSQ